jgi:small subunit ribosomal protein S16|uniref:Small ribosomal subunit protein bS16 n=1 Tax=Leptospirillum ferrodiazotrophum TaxID=412449 RepID=C6HV25_9BACT|nr:MAG: ribosomal protein S16 [Leptospirillum ferrodiazotrophum]
MAVHIRLARHGRRKMPVYRIVVADSRMPRDGRFIEVVGTYAPQQSDGELRINQEKVDSWVSKGAVPTDTVARLIKRAASKS